MFNDFLLHTSLKKKKELHANLVAKMQFVRATATYLVWCLTLILCERFEVNLPQRDF